MKMENTLEAVAENTSILELNVDGFSTVVLFSKQHSIEFPKRKRFEKRETISLNRMEIMELTTKPFRMYLGFGTYTVYGIHSVGALVRSQ